LRLYLSSFRMGDHPEYPAALAGESGRSAVVIANALDDAPAGVRGSGVETELAGLAGLGFDAGAVARAYGCEPVRDGLGLLGEAFVPAQPVTGTPRDGRDRPRGGTRPGRRCRVP
jgi:hypothetical protein